MIDSPPNTDVGADVRANAGPNVRGDIDYFFEIARMADLRCKDLGPKTVATNHLAVALEILATHGGRESALAQLEDLRRALAGQNPNTRRTPSRRRRKPRSRKPK